MMDAQNIEAEPAEPEVDPHAPKKRTRKPLIISPDGRRPARVMDWGAGDGAAKRRRLALAVWRDNVMSSKIDSSRTVKVAWILCDLFNLKKGHCFATDEALARRTGVHRSHITTALKDLEDRRLIVRDHVEDKGKLKRRIWPRLPGGYANPAYVPDTPDRL